MKISDEDLQDIVENQGVYFDGMHANLAKELQAARKLNRKIVAIIDDTYGDDFPTDRIMQKIKELENEKV